MKFVIVRALMLCAFQAWSLAAIAGTEVYTGTLGNQPIVMELKSDGSSDIEGRYFYVKYHADLQLAGQASGTDSLSLQEGYSDYDKSVLPKIELKKDAQGQWSGTWTKSKEKSVALHLQPAQVPAPAANADPWFKKLYTSNLYEYLRLSGLTLKKGERQTFMGHTLQWWSEPGSKISMFEILDGYPDAQRQKINEVLRARLWQEVSNFHGCVSGNRSSGSNYDQTVTPNLLSANLISISVFTDYYCGGAYPDWGDDPINMDARTAQPLTLEDILWVGEGKPVRYASALPYGYDEGADKKDSDSYASYRRTRFAPWLIQQLQTLRPASVDENGCDSDYPDDPETAFWWQFPTWYLTSEGIVFTPSYPHVAAVCRIETPALPWKIVREHPGVLKMTLP
ncbi:MAG: hypothetical protein LBE24_01020 [Methylobacillus sp.]|jgi:hypothetical protein|nr:hypothetical protein [Methylobacillus sp.]